MTHSLQLRTSAQPSSEPAIHAQGPITIGSWAGATVEVAGSPAPIAAVIDLHEHGAILICLSPGACLLNGRPVSRAQLTAGDEIRSGDRVLHVEDGGRSATSTRRCIRLRWGTSVLDVRV